MLTKRLYKTESLRVIKIQKNKLLIQKNLINDLKHKSNLNFVIQIENSDGKNNNEFKIIKEILEMIANDN